MMIKKEFVNEIQLKEQLKEYGIDLREGFRWVLRDLSEEVVKELQIGYAPHIVTSDSIETIEENYAGSSWHRHISFSPILLFVDSGTRPHGVPDGKLNIYADHYDMRLRKLWGIIYKEGTKPHPFIDDSIGRATNRADEIIEKYLRGV